jgi:hypothetical protein
MAAKTTTAIDSTGRVSNQSPIADPWRVPSLRMLYDETPASGRTRYYPARYFLPY